MTPFGVFDTEDDTREVLAAGKTGFDKRLTKIGAVTSAGDVYTNNGDVPAFLQWAEQTGITRWYAHNLAYDEGNLFGDEIDTICHKMVGSRLIRFQKNGFTFLDSFNLFPMKVAKIGESMGKEKLVMNIHDDRYVLRDCEIVHDAIANLARIVEPYGIKSLPATLGSVCVAVWKGMGGKNWRDDSLFSKAALYGGRTEIFSPGGSGCIGWVDVNSLYPWAMTQRFPVSNDEHDDLVPYGIADVTVEIPKQPLAPLPVRARDGEIPGVGAGAVLFPTGKVRGTWVCAEIMAAVKYHGVKVLRVHKCMGSKRGDYYYRKFIETFYRKRIETDDPAMNLVYKLLLNNLFGQLGMDGVAQFTAQLDPAELEDGRAKGWDIRGYGDAFLIERRMPLPKHVNYSHAAHVTAYGRLRLNHYCRMLPPENLIYTDTDSIFFFHDPAKPFPFKHGNKLGEMKIEGVGSRVRTIAPKMYEYVTEEGERILKTKGVPKDYADEFFREGKVYYDAPFKLRESILFFDKKVVLDKKGREIWITQKRANGRKLSVWRKVKKTLRTSYQKKILVDGERWMPLHLNLSKRRSGSDD
jgi:hypothetical protein